MNIEAIFEAEAVSISNLFSTDGGNVGFRIPVYQRPYDWTTANIQRLFEDMLSGIEWRSTNPDSLSFIGTIITLSGEKKEVSFDGQSLSIIDGQQRLTTIALLSCVLHDQIRAAVIRLADKPVDGKIIDWLKNESKHTLLKLLNIIRGNLITDGGTGVFPFPRIIREEFDNRASNFSGKQYDSTISDVLFKFASEYLSLGDDHLRSFPEWMNLGTSEESISVKRNLLLMQQFTQGVRDNDESKFPSDFASNFIPIPKLGRKGFKNLMQKLPLEDRVAANILDLCSLDINSREVVRLITFANYLLEGVVVTLVKVKDEKYGFDIFESLNSTGEPLTAIQTFKPAIIKFEQTDAKYKGSLSETYFSSVESYTNSFTKTSVKQRISKEIVVSFALYITGEKIGGGLDAQRRYLRNNFEQINRGKDALKIKRDFVKYLGVVA